MFHKRTIFISLIIFLIVLTDLSPVRGQSNAVPRFESAPCPVKFQSYGDRDVQCGFLIVPEDHSNLDGATLKIAVAIFKTHAQKPDPDPIIYLSGGPGSRTLDSFVPGLGRYLEIALFQRDIILVDQRGMGYSEPSLACPELDTLSLRPQQGPGSADQTLQLVAVQQCYDRLTQQGVNIAAFNTVESTGDIAAIGPTLGYTEVNIYGGSYGSTLALELMRHYPEGIRSVVLQGVTPPEVDLMASFAPDFEYALNRMFEACTADAKCKAAYPNLQNHFYEVLARLEQQPLALKLVNPANSQPITYFVDANDFISGVQWGLYSSSVIAQLPGLIEAVYNGHTQVLEPLALSTFGSQALSTPGANYAMRCMDDVMMTTPNAWENAIDGINPAFQDNFRTGKNWWYQICGMGWGAHQLDPVENTPVKSDIPTLMMTGAFDPVTPSNWAVSAAQNLPNSFVFEFPDSGHGVDPTICATRIFQAFIDHPQTRPNGSCIAQLKGIQFVVP